MFLSTKHSSKVFLIVDEQHIINNFTTKGEGVKYVIRVFLRYDSKGTSSITHLSRVSRPGRRVYVGAGEIPRVLGGYGINIVSTSRGLMSGKKARSENVGGEILAEVY